MESDEIPVGQKILNAAQTGNLDLFKKLAKQFDEEGKELKKTIEDIKDANKRGALHFAAREGKIEVCKYLLEELKLDVDTKDEDGETALFHATRQGHTSTVQYLLVSRADFSISNNRGETIMQHAVGEGLKDLIALVQMSFFGFILDINRTVTAQEVGTDLVHGLLPSDHKKPTPCTILRVDARWRQLMEQFEENPHKDRIHVRGTRMMKDEKVAVVTEKLDMSLQTWMERHSPINEDGVLDFDMFVKPFSAMIKSIIATRYLRPDFRFTENDTFLTSTKDELQVKLCILHEVPSECSEMEGLECLRCLHKIILKWFVSRGHYTLPRDLYLLIQTMREQPAHRFPPKGPEMKIFLHSPIFYRGEDRVKVFDLFLRIYWWKIVVELNRSDTLLEKAYAQMGIPLSLNAPWYRDRVLGPLLQKCYDSRRRPPNNMTQMLRGYRNLVMHFKKYHDPLDPLMMEPIYNELEQLLPHSWAMIHSIAVALFPKELVDIR